jgi:hypothetical protein
MLEPFQMALTKIRVAACLIVLLVLMAPAIAGPAAYAACMTACMATPVTVGGIATLVTGGGGAVVAAPAIGSSAAMCNGICAYLLALPTP